MFQCKEHGPIFQKLRDFQAVVGAFLDSNFETSDTWPLIMRACGPAVEQSAHPQSSVIGTLALIGISAMAVSGAQAGLTVLSAVLRLFFPRKPRILDKFYVLEMAKAINAELSFAGVQGPEFPGLRLDVKEQILSAKECPVGWPSEKVDLEPLSGQAANAAMEAGLSYIGVCKSPEHQRVISNVVDSNSLKLITQQGHFQVGSYRYRSQ
ncbi:hypothetical protein AK812_SmicGene13474 [Symbiodinium microadriaticum]|uniref:Uncharacterized protein n=1 Tax=Symbiodinium microadriaticum TaxID=2951 RepID=A0A1Q9E7Z6_SYMMI|nr:hypothetical protein AK812_SmicGene13474 [Symbiodinium microadriaticum]